MSMHQLRQKKKRQVAPKCLLQSADAFSLQPSAVSDGVQVGANWPDIHQCWREDKWHILPWHASDSKATACNAWDLCCILYLPTMQCSAAANWAWDNLREWQTPVLLSLHHISRTQQHRSEHALTTKDGEKCSSESTKFRMSMNWSSVWLMSGTVLRVSSMMQVMSSANVSVWVLLWK